MAYSLGGRVFDRALTRRDFLWLASASAVVMVLPGLNGCAVDPVTGEKQLVLMSEAQEKAVDREQSPHQFSADYGVIQQAETIKRLFGHGVGFGGCVGMDFFERQLDVAPGR